MGRKRLGIDVGGTGVKGAIFDIDQGILISEKVKFATPEPKDPRAISSCVKKIVAELDWDGPIGIGFPAIVKKGVSASASNIHQDWINFPVEDFFSEELGQKVRVVNDADAAGLAEVNFGNGKDQIGTIILLTIGTGIGSAIFSNGILVSNSELGHMEYMGRDAEHILSRKAKEDRGLSMDQWAQEFNGFLSKLDFLFSPNLFILGGGISKHFDKFKHHFNPEMHVTNAQLLNNAGILGAALSSEL